MYKLEYGLETLIDQVCKVVLNLLSPLNVDNVQAHVGHEVYALSQLLLTFVLCLLYLQAHVPTDPSYFGVVPHGIVHLTKSMALGSKAYIQ